MVYNSLSLSSSHWASVNQIKASEFATTKASRLQVLVPDFTISRDSGGVQYKLYYMTGNDNVARNDLQKTRGATNIAL